MYSDHSPVRRPHVMWAPEPIARDSDEGTVDRDAVLRKLIATVPDEEERARYAEILLGDRDDALDGRGSTAPAMDAAFPHRHRLGR